MSAGPVGSRAPDPVVQRLDGSKVPLSSLRRGPLTAHVFLRHAGCPFCRDQVAVLNDDRARLEAAGVVIVPVSLGTPDKTAAVWKAFDIRFDVACAPDGAVHDAFGLRRGGFFRVTGPQVWWPALRAMLRGRGMALPKGPEWKYLPGCVLVDASGTIVARADGTHAADHLEADGVIALARSVVHAATAR